MIGSIKAGEKVEVTKGNGEWAHVLYEGKTGLVKMEYLTAVDTEEKGVAKEQAGAKEQSVVDEQAGAGTGQGAGGSQETEAGE